MDSVQGRQVLEEQHRRFYNTQAQQPAFGRANVTSEQPKRSYEPELRELIEEQRELIVQQQRFIAQQQQATESQLQPQLDQLQKLLDELQQQVKKTRY